MELIDKLDYPNFGQNYILYLEMGDVFIAKAQYKSALNYFDKAEKMFNHLKEGSNVDPVNER